MPFVLLEHYKRVRFGAFTKTETLWHTGSLPIIDLNISPVFTVRIHFQFRRFLANVRTPLLWRYQVQCSSWYWRARKLTSSLKFRVNRGAFRTKSRVLEMKEKSGVFREILFNVIYKMAMAVVAVLILLSVEHAFPHSTILVRWSVKPEAEYGFFATLAQVAATMLGLYFTAVSLVASTSYARAPGNLRALIIEEQVGNFYFSFLAHFAATAVTMLAAVSLGVPIGALNIFWLSFLGLFAVFSFVLLGLRTFSFFDPTALVRHLNPRLARAMSEVTPTGYKWLDPSFQSHQQRDADRAIEAYANLIVIAEQSENLNARTLVELAEGLFAALNHYALIKCRIPTKSLWFRRHPKHKQWLLAPSHELEIARSTDTALQPEMVPDLNWFENNINQALTKIITRLCTRADLTGLITVLNAAQIYARNAATLGCPEEAFILLNAVGAELESSFADVIFDSTSDDSIKQSLNRLAAIDMHALAVMNVLLGTSHALEMTNCATFAQQTTQIEWRKSAAIYHNKNFPREVLKQYEEIQDRLFFEEEVEGKIVTPDWLQCEFAALGYTRFLAEIVGSILAKFETRFGDAVELRVNAKDFIGATSLIHRGLEATNKLDVHLPRIRAYWDDLVILNRSRDWEWPTINWDDFSKRITALRDRQIKHLTACISTLINFPNKQQFPDLFGQTYSILADSCFDALIRGDEAIFTAVFPPYFTMAFQAHQRVRSVLGKITNQNVVATLGPLSDLLAISGFAELYSAHTTKNFNSVSRKIWDALFNGQTDDASRKNLIVLLSATKEPLLGTSSRDMLRFRWQRSTCDYFDKHGIPVDDFGFSSYRKNHIRHPSPLVRVFASRGDLLNDPEDIFFAVYLFMRPEASGLKVPEMIKSYQQALNRETSGKEDEDEET